MLATLHIQAGTQREWAPHVAARRTPGPQLSVVDRVQELVGRLIAEASLPKPGAPHSDGYDGDGYIIVRHPDTEVVTAAIKDDHRDHRDRVRLTLWHPRAIRYTSALSPL